MGALNYIIYIAIVQSPSIHIVFYYNICLTVLPTQTRKSMYYYRNPYSPSEIVDGPSRQPDEFCLNKCLRLVTSTVTNINIGTEGLWRNLSCLGF